MRANIREWLQRDASIDEAMSAAYGFEVLYGGSDPDQFDLGGTIRQSFSFERQDGTSGGFFYGGNVVPRIGSTLYLFLELARSQGFGFAVGMLQLELNRFQSDDEMRTVDGRTWFDDVYASVSYNGVSFSTPAATFRGTDSVLQISAPVTLVCNDTFGIAPATTMSYEYFQNGVHALGIETYRARVSPNAQLDAYARLQVFDREGLDIRHGAISARLSAAAVHLRAWHLIASAGASYVSDLDMEPRFGGIVSAGITFADQAFRYNAPSLNVIVARNYEPYYHRMPVVDSWILWIQYGVHP